MFHVKTFAVFINHENHETFHVYGSCNMSTSSWPGIFTQSPIHTAKTKGVLIRQNMSAHATAVIYHAWSLLLASSKQLMKNN